MTNLSEEMIQIIEEQRVSELIRAEKEYPETFQFFINLRSDLNYLFHLSDEEGIELNQLPSCIHKMEYQWGAVSLTNIIFMHKIRKHKALHFLVRDNIDAIPNFLQENENDIVFYFNDIKLETIKILLKTIKEEVRTTTPELFFETFYLKQKELQENLIEYVNNKTYFDYYPEEYSILLIKQQCFYRVIGQLKSENVNVVKEEFELYCDYLLKKID